MFERASRLKLRFNTDRGFCNVEDLWDLPLDSLDSIFKDLNGQLKDHNSESLLVVKKAPTEKLELKVDVIKHVVKTRLVEQATAENAQLNSVRKQKLLGILANKQDAELLDKTPEEITKMIDELN